MNLDQLQQVAEAILSKLEFYAPRYYGPDLDTAKERRAQHFGCWGKIIGTWVN